MTDNMRHVSILIQGVVVADNDQAAYAQMLNNVLDEVPSPTIIDCQVKTIIRPLTMEEVEPLVLDVDKFLGER